MRGLVQLYPRYSHLYGTLRDNIRFLVLHNLVEFPFATVNTVNALGRWVVTSFTGKTYSRVVMACIWWIYESTSIHFVILYKVRTKLYERESNSRFICVQKWFSTFSSLQYCFSTKLRFQRLWPGRICALTSTNAFLFRSSMCGRRNRYRDIRFAILGGTVFLRGPKIVLEKQMRE